ncbi:MAG: valine--tRNA ligase [Fibrella sp.]|nr:valine--tRNA ligase [Armatimonadota bacterium]
MSLTELPIRYDPQATEATIYAQWEAANCFRATADDNPKRYCVTIPPPNITGALHLGHALNHTIMDTLGRWKRMLGYNTLILPGTDHGGISTQSVVEKQIAKDKLTRQDLGREKFEARVNEWADEYGGIILGQLRRLGCAYDWERTRYTLDESYVDGIMTVFARLYETGYIYLGRRIVNWCPFHRSAISDIEVEPEEEKSFLYHIRYDFSDGSGSVTVATTRPETMFGDSAVAVNPDDERYTAQIGKLLCLPIVGREIPLIADDFAQKEFGTGAVKVTPAHDPNDFECGLRHNLEQIVVIGEDAHMTAAAGADYVGLDRFAARKKVLAALEADGFLVRVEDHIKRVGRCDRCKTVVEPLLSRQWFCKMGGTDMVNRAIEVVRNDEVRFVPPRYKDTYLRWMENLRDWPISRQLWWGHRMPLWRSEGSDPGEQSSYVVALTDAEARQKLNSPDIIQIDDVLDTWFSSALWPFATLGWPAESEQAKRDLAYYYPTDALFTAQEILYLWVARMIMMGEEFIDAKPYSDVYIHATILDEKGHRMSKTKGNGIDPVDLIELYGADAVRFALAREAGQRQDMRIKPIKDGKQEQVELARNFAGKIWNASRFVLMNLGDFRPAGRTEPPARTLQLVDRWIISRLNATTKIVNDSLATYNLDDAARALYEFFWDDFCDWYVEAVKPRLAGDGADQAKAVLWFTLESSLRLLHPIMPYLTEAIWQTVPGAKEVAGKEFLMFAQFPEPDPAYWHPDAERDFPVLQDTVRAIRNLRAENSIKGSGGEVFIAFNDEANRALLADADNAALVRSLARVETITLAEGPTDGYLAATKYGTVRLPRPEVSAEELAQERARIEKELAKIEKDKAGLTVRLENPEFLARSPQPVVEKARAQAAELDEKRTKLSERLAQIVQ